MTMMWLTAAFVEETLFQGYLMTRPAGAIGTGATSLVYGADYLFARRNLWPVVIVHGIAKRSRLRARH
jgi:membrane protease YdiL (CAAX protease family)